MKPRTWITVITVAGVGVAATRPGTPPRRIVKRTIHTGRKRTRAMVGRAQGALYRARDQHPDPDVPDLVLADRIRSELGQLEKQLDLPRIHVAVFDHVAHLHGVVATRADIVTIENAVLAVSGVREVESALHVGLSVSDTRPSAGRLRHELQWSDAKHRLVDVVLERGIDESSAIVLVNAILESFAERLPDGEREHVLAHLPADVKAMFVLPWRRHQDRRQRHLAAFVNDVSFRSSLALTDEVIAAATEDVLHTLRALVPDEARDVQAVLPADLRAIWAHADESPPMT